MNPEVVETLEKVRNSSPAHPDTDGDGDSGDGNRQHPVQAQADLTKLGLKIPSDEDSSSDEKTPGELQVEVVRAVVSRMLDLHSRIGQQIFEGKYRACLTGGYSGQTLIHCILVYKGSLNLVEVEPLLGTALKVMPSLLEERDGNGETALHMAIRMRKSIFVRKICEMSPRPAEAIACLGPHRRNCLHAAIWAGLPCVPYLIETAGKSALLQIDGGGNTPLHLAVDFAHCVDGQIEVVSDLVGKCLAAANVFNTAGQSVYQFHIASQKRYRDSAEKKPKTVLSEAPYRVSERPERGEKPLYEGKFPPPKEESLEPVEGPSRRIRMSKRPPTDINRPASPSHKIAAAIEQLLKVAFMSNYGIGESMRFLYGNGEERELSFDLRASKLADHAAITRQLKNLAKFLRFETVLKYVAIPRLCKQTESEDKSNARSGVSAQARHHILDAPATIVSIFDWLRRCGVHKILRVIIEDAGDPPYSDEVIEQCLEGFDVEEWDWKTLDICSETIFHIAPNARFLHLYSSGNHGVLRSWSAIDGIVKLRLLRQVHLTVSANLQGLQRTLRNVEEFHNRLSNLSYIEVLKDIVDFEEKREGIQPTLVKQQLPEAQLWINSLRSISKLLWGLNYHSSVAPTKIAVIDDGVDARSPFLASQIAMGRSFIHSDEDLNHESPFYISTNGHGTAMAEIIGDCASSSTITVARVDVEADAKYRNLISAIEWAVAKNVDIICIGAFLDWPIMWSDPDFIAQAHDLENAMAVAEQKGIQTLCVQFARPHAGVLQSVITPQVLLEFGVASTTITDFTFPGQYFGHQQKLVENDVLSHNCVATALATSLAAELYTLAKLLVALPIGAVLDKRLLPAMVVRSSFQRLTRENKTKYVHVHQVAKEAEQWLEESEEGDGRNEILHNIWQMLFQEPP